MNGNFGKLARKAPIALGVSLRPPRDDRREPFPLHFITERQRGDLEDGKYPGPWQIATPLSRLLMTCFITAVAGVPIDNFSGHLRNPVLCVFAKSMGAGDGG